MKKVGEVKVAAKWKLNRAGLLNFWYYDEEVFEFEDGKLLLRGTNGSGKSVTMQSFLPVLLDGKKSPDRLDPFGSKSRRMEDYLLGEKEVSNRDERTGYLFIEFKMENTNQYLTIGQGMQAKRGQPLKSWGFVITDNRRIGEDITLYKWVNEGHEKKKFPRSLVELETVIGSGGEVVQSNKEYAALVNKYIFGFESLEAYDDLIKVLIQLRSPKLSKDFKPTVIYEILTEALPPLTDEDLRYLTEIIETMDQTQQQMEQLEREFQALEKLNKAYEQYNQRILSEQISDWKNAKNRCKKEKRHLFELQEEIEMGKSQIQHLMGQERELNLAKVTLSEDLERLQSHEIFQLEKSLEEKAQSQTKVRIKITDEQKQLYKKLDSERTNVKELEKIAQEYNDQKRKMTEIIEELAHLSEESAFPNHKQNMTEFLQQKEQPFDFLLWKQEGKAHTDLLKKVLDVLRLQKQKRDSIQEKNRELDKLEQERDAFQEEAKKWQDILEEEKQKLLNEIHLWTEKNEKYGVSALTLQQVSRDVEDLFSSVEYERVKEQIEPFVLQFERHLLYQKSKFESEKTNIEEKLVQLKEEWRIRKEQKDPEPERHQATIEARKTLETNGVIFAPLYELVDFQDSVTEEEKKRLESALLETGFLDALVTSEDISIRHDRILLENPKLLTQTLADYLKPDLGQSKISKERIINILQSIEMSMDATVRFSDDGSYKIGALCGHALPLEEVRFIGREARVRYRAQLMTQLEQEMAICEANIKRVNQQIQEQDQQLQFSRECWMNFPKSTEVKMGFDEMENMKREVQIREKPIGELSQQILKLDQDLQEIKSQIFRLTEGIYLEKEVTCYEEAWDCSQDYEKEIIQLDLEHKAYLRALEDELREKENLEELQNEIDYRQGELNVLQDELDKLTESMANIERQLQLKGMDEVREQIQVTSKKLKEVETELDRVKTKLPTETTKLEMAKVNKVNQGKVFEFWTKMEQTWGQSIKREWLRQGKEEHLLEESQLNLIGEKKGKEKNALESSLTNLYYSLQSDLLEHRMRIFTEEASNMEWMEEVQEEEWLPIIEQWRAKNSRKMIEFDQRGVKISPATLFERVSQEWSAQETRLNELDKKLYEEILLHSIGNKLRAKIRRAQQWTEKMRVILENRDISSGLKFSLKWSPRTADSEQELDTKDLVTLLKQDASLLSETDIEKVTNHFRSKIQSAKNWIEEKGEGQTLLQVLKMVLDYRQWFSFKLYYERPNEPRRELTNHRFFQFSGGEKALSMYIPLFTACYSRYQEAADHAPYIISLDEAFAGVDENNINEMFEVVEQLDFNYMMNSQILWGDYETVKSLAISELLRPKNADYVTVINYKWDGNIMEMKS